MRGNRFLKSSLPLLLAAGLGACASNGVQPGIVSRSGPTSGPTQSYVPNPTYGQNQAYVQNASATSSGPVNGAASYGESGRVVSINEVGLRGSGGGSGNGPLIGGLLGGAGINIATFHVGREALRRPMCAAHCLHCVDAARLEILTRPGPTRDELDFR